MDTCIALRTMLVKDGVAYLQAGGGIVFDSDPYDEWDETMNKLKANMTCISAAEEKHRAEEEEVLFGGRGGGAGAEARAEALVREFIVGEEGDGQGEGPRTGRHAEGETYVDLSGG